MQSTNWLLALALAAPVGFLFARTGAPEHGHHHAGPASSASGATVLVTVNGHAITEADLFAKVRGETRGMAPSPDKRKAALEALVSQELMYQHARELGLDADPKFAEESLDADAQIAAFKRRRLSDIFVEREIVAKSETTDAEARKYFDENGPRVRSELHVEQIFRRGRPAIEAAQAALASGKSFEDVAGAGMEGMPMGRKPMWDLGFTKWLMLPEPMREPAFALKPGEVSGIIAGTNDRYWIIKLVEKKDDPSVTFDAVKPIIADALKQQKIEQKRAQIERELHDRAKIEWAK